VDSSFRKVVCKPGLHLIVGFLKECPGFPVHPCGGLAHCVDVIPVRSFNRNFKVPRNLGDVIVKFNPPLVEGFSLLVHLFRLEQSRQVSGEFLRRHGGLIQTDRWLDGRCSEVPRFLCGSRRCSTTNRCGGCFRAQQSLDLGP
jgi:hypothetical protein